MLKPSRVIEVYEDDSGKWRWRAIARNSKTTAASAEAFDSRGNALKAAQRERKAWWMLVEVVVRE